MVLFLGHDIAYDTNGNRDDIIHYWSSNGNHTDINAGYSVAQCNASKIYRAVLTSITKPQNFNNAKKIDRFYVNQWPSDYGKVTVSMPLPASLSGRSGVVIAHMKDGGSIIYITPTIHNGIITFQTDSFSKYAVVLTSNTARTNTPSTGDHSFPPIVLLLVAIFSVLGMIVIHRFVPKHSSGSH